jgi:N-acyl-L-homoserine lactone synthetase
MFSHMNSESALYAYQPDEFDAPDAVYCVYVDDRAGIIGSARLLPRPALLASHIELTKGEKGLWECNRVFFDLDGNSPIHEDGEAFEQVTRQFYRGVYEGMKKFAETNGIKSILSVNPIDEHEDIVYFGEWPFEVESQIEIEVAEGVTDTFAVGGCSFN